MHACLVAAVADQRQDQDGADGGIDLAIDLPATDHPRFACGAFFWPAGAGGKEFGLRSGAGRERIGK